MMQNIFNVLNYRQGLSQILWQEAESTEGPAPLLDQLKVRFPRMRLVVL